MKITKIADELRKWPACNAGTDDRGIEIGECRLALKTSLYSLARDRVDMYSNLVM